MSYIAGLVPGTKAASTCQVDIQGTQSSQFRCGSGPIINITSDEDRRLSLGLKRKESSEPRVNFNLPKENSCPSSREKFRSSPRFPHRIMPANSVGTITSSQLNAVSTPHRWHSMEDSWKPRVSSYLRSSSYNPNFEEGGILLTELTQLKRETQSSPASDFETLTMPADSTLNTNDKNLYHDRHKLFQENILGKELNNLVEHGINSFCSNALEKKNDKKNQVQQDKACNEEVTTYADIGPPSSSIEKES